MDGNFPVHPDTLHIIWIFCIAKYPKILQPIMNLSQKTFRICKNFPVSIADALTGFLRLWFQVLAIFDLLTVPPITFQALI